MFFFTDKDKEEYCKRRGVVHSDLYEKHGFLRTGCACCPFGSRFEQELQTADKLDPGLEKAARAIFGASYAYTRAYRRFKAQCDEEKKSDKNQLSMFEDEI